MHWLLSILFKKAKLLTIVGGSALGGGTIAVPVLVTGDRYEEYLFRKFNPEPAKYAVVDQQALQQASSGNSRTCNDENNSSNGTYTCDQSKFEKFPEVKEASNSELIRGTKKYNHGNYVLYFGSEACPNCNNMLYSENESPKTWLGADLKNIYKNGIFFETYSLAKHENKNNPDGLKKIEFIFFSDEVPEMGIRNNDELYTIPWNKWPNTLTNQGRIKGDNMRNDKSAVSFRKLHSLLTYYFGSKISGIPTIIIYKDGTPFVYGSDKIEEIEEEKKKSGEQIKTLQHAEAENSSAAAVFRYDLFKHLKYIYEGKYMWYL
ncbi:hypothetical protein WEN_01075 [Mycoplasma wenyonii str. Massachusetts]|uniref:Uncharacterized protein n=1 Tax=Mycoplasma wenyonii (strain Massachusetts) TaxID=1197325 RepID=I6YL72_MYCWM|nr:hypothetical protein [Mycoplasma wenyonii]AFN65014.1 hypothetical protein WEN_01075 [Mycoplasma wenyonii str. Massachusetts]